MTVHRGSSLVAWLQDTKAVYLDNATSVRDYRVQLRGNRSVLLFGLYLVVLIGVAMTVYGQAAGVGAIEVVEAQQKLRGFYGTIMALLGGIVCLIAPALSATTVVAEKQRRSLDLVFSAPVSPKYYLVGKMISSYRYTWMLLVLSLPVTAACVVLGGASWADVLVAYVLLSTQALILTAMALLMSTIATKPVPAILSSYCVTLFYLVVTAGFAGPTVGRGLFGHAGNEAPFLATLNPFFVQATQATYTMIATVQAPNWILSMAFALLISKICLLGAGSLLSPSPAKEIRSLRLHALVYVGAFALYLGWSSAGIVPGTTLGANDAGRALFWLSMLLFLFMPFLSTFGVDAERRFWPNGTFRLRHTLDGTPAGGLPYVLLFLAVCLASIWSGLRFGRAITMGLGDALPWVVYCVGFWTFFWAAGRYASSLFVGVKSARTLQFATFILLVLLPVPFLSSITNASAGTSLGSPWDLYPLRPLFVDRSNADTLAYIWGTGFLVVALLVTFAAERRTGRKLALLKDRDGGPILAA